MVRWDWPPVRRPVEDCHCEGVCCKVAGPTLLFLLTTRHAASASSVHAGTQRPVSITQAVLLLYCHAVKQASISKGRWIQQELSWEQAAGQEQEHTCWPGARVLIGSSRLGSAAASPTGAAAAAALPPALSPAAAVAPDAARGAPASAPHSCLCRAFQSFLCSTKRRGARLWHTQHLLPGRLT